MLMLSFTFVIVCDILSGNKSGQFFFIVCLYMYCRWRSSYQVGKVGTPLTGSTPPHYCACPKPGHGSPTSYVVGFLYSVKIRVHCSFC